MTGDSITIGGRPVGAGAPVYVIAEVSANHGGELERAEAIMRVAAASGADAVKFQTYRPDTMTLDVDEPAFRAGGLWEGRLLHDLYEEAQTPWDWFPRLFALGHELGLDVFSSPFDETAVDFLEQFDPPAYKVASFEMVDLELIAAMARTGKPMIISTGMATIDETSLAVETARDAGAKELALLRCNSAYPAPIEEMDLRTIPDMIARWNVPVGLSDHTLGIAASVAAVTLGASILERHVTLSRDQPTPDSAFSLEPHELTALVGAVRDVEGALGGVRYGPSHAEAGSLNSRRSLYVVEDVAVGAVLDRTNVRAIRPGDGLPPKELPRVLGQAVRRDVARGTPLTWSLLEDDTEP
jgi:pseudaminic acid synthase